MKIKYNLKDNYLKYYNEAMGVFFMKNKLKKKHNAKIRSYTANLNLQYFFITLAIVISLILFSIFDEQSFLKFSCYLLVIDIFAYIISMAILFVGFKQAYSNVKEEIIEINSYGISDITEGRLKIETSYDTIELVAITKNLIVFVTKSPFIIFIKNDKKDEVIKEIKKYSDVLIIDNVQ